VSTATKRLISIEEYERMAEDGDDEPVELIEGRIVAKMPKSPPHMASVKKTQRTIERLLPAGWHCCTEAPVRIPSRDSEPEPDVSVVRGSIDDYETRHPDASLDEVALVVEVSRSSVADDRALAPTYGAAGIPAYWIINVAARQLEVYSGPVAGAYPSPTILDESASVELVIDGQVVGRIPVADLLPRRP
jgi:Uma2 family endonuclease